MRAVAIIYSFEAVFTISYCICNMVSSSPRRLMGSMITTGLRGAGFASRCNFVFFGIISVLGLVELGFRIRVSVVV